MPNEIFIPSNRGKLLPISEVDAICEEVRKGFPRRYIETFLKVQTDEGKVVPFTFTPNQDYFYKMTFEVPGRWKSGFWADFIKDRKAKASSFIGGCCFSFLTNVPNFDGIILGGLEEHAQVPLKMFDTFYNNLPDTVNPQTGIPIMRPHKEHWDQSFREVGFGPNVMENGKWKVDVKVKSSVSISTSRTAGGVRGGTPWFLWEIEKAQFDQAFEQPLMTSILNSLPKRYFRFTDSTPLGTKNGHYKDFKAIQSGEVNGILVSRFWFQNAVNSLSVTDSAVLPKDRREVEQTGTLTYTDAEQSVIKLFPDDDVPISNRILWRRAKIAEAVRAALGDEARGMALFLQEHMENLSDCWNDATTSHFDMAMIRRMIDGAREPLPESKLREFGLSSMPIPGLKFQAWEMPRMGGRYFGGMDMAKGKQYGDDSVMQIFDASTGRFVAKLKGKASLLRSVRAGADIMRIYNMGLFGPERNGLGEGAIEALVEYGYPNIYYPESNKPISFDKVTPREYGFYTSSHTRPQMFGHFQEGVATGQYDIPDIELVEAIKGWDPDPKSDEHAADDVMAAMISVEMSLQAWRFPSVNAQMPASARISAGREIRIETPQAYSRWLH